jgi:hypothetical protein
MKGLRSVWFMVLICAVLAVPALSGAAEPSAKAKMATMTLGNEECGKCHTGPPADIAAAGGKHKEVGCTECHVGHRPSVKTSIPQCSKCHEDKPHYKLANCLGCHKNPHRPLEIQFGNKVTEPCLTCHTDQIKQLQANKSKHTALFCSTCHSVHGKIPQCVQCHKPHSAQMTQADCKKCHKAHMPTVVAYGPDVPNKDCAACHAKANNLLMASATKHKAQPCVSCHKAKHKMIPACQNCHGDKHPKAIMEKFPKCSQCHNIAHDLNHWTAPAPAAAAPAKKATKKK